MALVTSCYNDNMWYGHNTHTYANPLGWPLGYPNRCMRKLSSLMTHSPYHSWHSRKLLRNATILNKLWKFCIILLDFIPLINISSWEVGNFEFPFGEWGTLFLNIDPNKKINILKFDGNQMVAKYSVRWDFIFKLACLSKVYVGDAHCTLAKSLE